MDHLMMTKLYLDGLMLRAAVPSCGFWSLCAFLSFSFKSRLFQNRLLRDNDADASRADRRYVSIRPSLTWNFAPWWKLIGTYQYRREKRDGEPESAESNAIFVSVVYSKPTNISE